MNQSELNKIKKDLEDDLKITDDNVLDKTKTVPHLYQKYLSVYIKESMLLKKLKSDLDEFYGLAFKKLFEGDRKLNKGEIDQFICAEKEYVNMKRQMEFQEQVCIFLEKSVDNVKAMSYNLNNYISLRKFLGGA